MDVFVSASRSEGFPNALAEAMLAELPCVATEVGDTALVLDDCGTLAPVGDHMALGRAVAACLTKTAEEREEMGRRARQRVVDCFSMQRCVDAYERLYADLLRSNCGRAY